MPTAMSAGACAVSAATVPAAVSATTMPGAMSANCTVFAAAVSANCAVFAAAVSPATMPAAVSPATMPAAASAATPSGVCFECEKRHYEEQHGGHASAGRQHRPYSVAGLGAPHRRSRLSLGILPRTKSI